MPSLSLTLNVESLSKIPQGGEPLNLVVTIKVFQITGLDVYWTLGKGDGAMKRYHHFTHVLGFILLFFLMAGCGPRQIEPPVETLGSTCVEGTVWYRGPTDSALLRYPRAKITAWHHKTENPLGETQADRSGNFCMDVPAGDFSVDLRVWGLQRLSKTNYTCDGSVDGVGLGTSGAKCKKSGCIKIAIVAECRKFIPGQRRFDY